MRRRRGRRALAGLAVFCLLLALAGLSAYEFALPGVGDARARAGRLVRAHHGQRDPLPLPTKLADALVAVEDEHFYSNVFLNVFDGAARAAVATVRRRGDPGGSTISQQLAKQLYPHGAGLAGTLEEIGLGVKLSLSYSKRQILEMYLNVVYFGNGYWGDAAAARGYFHRRPDQLTWAQASLLAGLPQAPSRYDPLQDYQLAKQRQRHVLDQLAANHYLTRQQADSAYRQPLGLK